MSVAKEVTGDSVLVVTPVGGNSENVSVAKICAAVGELPTEVGTVYAIFSVWYDDKVVREGVSDRVVKVAGRVTEIPNDDDAYVHDDGVVLATDTTSW